MKLKKFPKGLIALSFALLIAGGTVILGAANSKAVAVIGGGVMENFVRITHFIF